MASRITRVYRKGRMLRNSLEQNKDLLWYAISLFCAFALGVICSIMGIWLILYFKWADVESLGFSFTKISSFIIALVGAIWSTVSKIHTPVGEISKSLQEHGNIPLDRLDSNGLTITSTIFRESKDVEFEETTSKQ